MRAKSFFWVWMICGLWSVGLGDEEPMRLTRREHEEARRRIFDLSLHELYLEKVKGAGAEATMARKALDAMGDRVATDEQAKAFLVEAASVLEKEVKLRQEWAIWAKGKMVRSMREKIGKAWVVMSKENDAIAGMVKRHEDKMPEKVRRWWKEREKAKAGPRVPEPEILEDVFPAKE